MDLDPNWFYSTLAQSTAAMVGLAGGFLVQRLLAQRSDIAQERADLRANAEAVFSTAASHRKVAARVIEALDAALVEIHAQEQSGAMQFEGQTYAQLFSLSHGENNWGGVPIPSVDFQLARHQVVETREVATGLRDALPESFEQFVDSLVKHRELRPRNDQGWLTSDLDLPRAEWLQSIDPQNFWDWMPRQRDVAREWWHGLNKNPNVGEVRTARGLGSHLAALRDRLIPRSSYVLLAILAGLLVFGVIAPLFSLSYGARDSRSLLLLAFVPLSLAFLGYIGYELWRIRRAVRIDRDSF